METQDLMIKGKIEFNKIKDLHKKGLTKGEILKSLNISYDQFQYNFEIIKNGFDSLSEYNKHVQDERNLQDICCKSLVLAYSEDQPVIKCGNSPYFIPNCFRVEEDFGCALRDIFGRKDGECSWNDRVKWSTVKNLEKLNKRILRGTQKIILSECDYASNFELFLSTSRRNFQVEWRYGVGVGLGLVKDSGKNH